MSRIATISSGRRVRLPDAAPAPADEPAEEVALEPSAISADPEPVVGDVWAAQIAEQEAPLDGYLTESPAEAPEQPETNTAAEPGHLTEDATERDPAHQDPRRSIVDVLRRRLEAVLQPVDDDDAWHGVYAITRKDLSAVLMQPLPEASALAAAVKTPAFVYVDAVCPICGIAGEIALEIDVRAIVEGHERQLKLVTTSKPLLHACYQTRISDVAPSRPEAQQRLPLSEASEADEPDIEEDVAADEKETSEHFDQRASDEREAAHRDLAAAEAADQQALDLGACPYPGCPLAAEHPGPHAPAEKSIEDDLDGDLLPF